MNEKRLVFIHLSDIHFKNMKSDFLDLDDDLRNELELDAVKISEKTGNINGILITGDIAYSGEAQEYEIAYKWLNRLCDRIQCQPENVWTIPGNHDVKRSVIENSRLLRGIHNELRNAGKDEIDKLLGEYLQDNMARKLLFEAIKNYNSFASKFQCEIDSGKPFWQNDFPLNDGSILRLLGLNSTLISDKNDDDGKNKLILGLFQYNKVKREQGVEYLTLCHHPPQWLRDEDAVNDMLNARACIQLFGHKHDQRIQKINERIRITAGAMHPERSGKKWLPTYNWLAVSIEGEADKRKLKVDIYPRVWDDKNKSFQAEFDQNGSDIRSYSLPVQSWTCPVVGPQCSELAHKISIETLKSEKLEDNYKCNQKGNYEMNPLRQLTYRFLSLPYDVRLKVAQELSLIQDDDDGLHGNELFKRFFQRAKEKQLIEKLKEIVDKRFEENQ